MPEIKNEIKNEFKIDTDDFIFQTNKEILNMSSTIIDSLKNYDSEPVIVNV